MDGSRLVPYLLKYILERIAQQGPSSRDPKVTVGICVVHIIVPRSVPVKDLHIYVLSNT